jgi:hypothetical protein
MSHKAKAVKPGEGMTREQLVRAHFDAYSDLAWKEHLEPKFERSGLGADAMRDYRQQWNAYTEKRDWAWWVQNAAQMSNDELRADIAECHEKIEAIDERRLPPEIRKRVQIAFQEILNGDSLSNDRSHDHTPARTKTREM